MKAKAFKKKPKHAITWWAMALGLLAILELPLLALYSLITKTMAAADLGPIVGIAGIVITVAAVLTGKIAFKKGERSWVLWLGFGPALLLAVFWLFMIIAEIISVIFGLGF
jgi:hypothetical protein